MVSLALKARIRRGRASRPLLLAAAASWLISGIAACGKEPDAGGEPVAPARAAPLQPTLDAGTDVDGVIKLYPDAPGLRFTLAGADPNQNDQLVIEEGLPAIAAEEAGLSFWSIDTYEFEYTEGSRMGKTARLHIRARGVEQLFDWQTQKGFLAGDESLGDQELSALVRVRGLFDPEHAVFELKIRGGEHTDEDPSLASCSLMTFATRAAPGVSRFGKELDHPLYDYVNLPPRLGVELTEGRWFGLKLVSYLDSARADRVYNQLFVDADPILPDGSLRNDYRLLAEYVDRAGVSTGRYDTMVSWRGYQSTLRIDGVDALDVARLSARAIEAPAAPPSGL
jgi:hypothetical protein